MSLASPEVSVAEVSASPQVARAEASHTEIPPSQVAYTLQGFLPSATTAASVPPGLTLNGLRETGNTSTLTVKPDASSLANNAASPRAVGSGDERAVNNTSGPSSSPYVGTTGDASPNVSTNGHDDRGPQGAGQPQQPPKFAATLSDLMSSFRSVGLKGPDRMKDTEQVKDVLDTMSPSMPQARDAERPRYHATRNPTQTPAYYPQQVLPLLSSPEFFERLDVETLFWVFYYMPGTYQQWMAAQELKKQAWRFHIKFLTWFQRHAKPDEVTDEYEQGQYLYFDWEGSWCVRRKSDFRFEYKNLSDD
ncbi:general negative regulator of transcription subunit 5 [Serendipita sp. 411]|nr:general negative regulator of transcription subunit 5 [Serendipita sp. 411]